MGRTASNAAVSLPDTCCEEVELPGLYVHVPFCRSKCSYCDFYSTCDTHGVDEWLSATEQEMSRYADRFPEVDTVYLGGGTPSVLQTTHLDRLFGMVRRFFRVAAGSEITFEANPNDLSEDLVVRLMEVGVNRISLGVQSFDDGILGFLGRRHGGEEARDAVRLIRSLAGLQVSIDLMYAVPGVSRSLWEDTVREAAAYRPEHISCYQLTVKEHTDLWDRRNSVPFPDEEEQEAQFLHTDRLLTSLGYLHYEVSNYALTSAYGARHNSKYWRRARYLGLGPSAHSFDGTLRWWNGSSLDEYIRIWSSGSGAPAGSERLSEEQCLMEQLLLGFRTSLGVGVDICRKLPNGPAAMESLQAEGLATLVGDRVVPTVRGMLLADSLPLSFV